jgi:hypothetical protein
MILKQYRVFPYHAFPIRSPLALNYLDRELKVEILGEEQFGANECGTWLKGWDKNIERV